MNSTTSSVAPKRPIVITVVSIIGFLWPLVLALALVVPVASGLPIWYGAFKLLVGIAGAVCFIGIWRMRRWGLFALVALVVLDQAISVSAGFGSARAMIFPGILIAAVACYFQRLR